MTDYLFVYGTLMKGEPNHHLISDCTLLNYIFINGVLFDTGRGYPVVFNSFQDPHEVAGELYILPDNNGEILEMLDRFKSVDSELFRREIINSGEKKINFYKGVYAPKKQLIINGSWLRHNSLAKHDHRGFALNFEESHKNNYRKYPDSSHPVAIYLPGDIPLLITAPHATTHKRDNRLKRYELYTAAISAILHAQTGAHALYSNYYSEKDPNYYDDSPFKNRMHQIIEEHDIELILDIHGTGEDRSCDIYPGLGINRSFLKGNHDIINNLHRTAVKHGLEVGSEQVFPAARQNTIAKYSALKLGKIAIQLEINKKFRKPLTHATNFNKLIKFLREFIIRSSDILQ